MKPQRARMFPYMPFNCGWQNTIQKRRQETDSIKNKANMRNIFLFAALAITAGSCSDKNRFDATGAFEATEVIVAAEQSGRILALNITEGDSLAAGQVIGGIDVTGLMLQRAQREANVKAIAERTIDPRPQLQLVRKQLDVQQSRLQQQLHEKTRITNLLKADAATRKELDD